MIKKRRRKVYLITYIGNLGNITDLNISNMMNLCIKHEMNKMGIEYY